MKHRRPDQKDKNNDVIKAEVETQGVHIMPIDRPVDWLVRYRDFGGLVEVKDERTQYRRIQLETAAETPWPFAFVKSASELMQFVKTQQGITDRQRRSIRTALDAEPERERWEPAMMKRILK